MTSLLSNQPLKGMVDLFPVDMEKHVYFEKKITQVLEKLCYSVYETPVLEPIDIYLNKSSRELLEEQSYSFEDRGGRKLLLRPELTPSLARMVSKVIKKETTPLKLYSLPKCYRYERPQKGRMREFRQLNIDILSSFNDDLMFRDLEIFFIINKIFNAFDIPVKDYKILYNNRYWLNKIFEENNFGREECQKIYSLLDRKDKITKEQLQQELDENFDSKKIDLFQKLITAKSPREIKVILDEKIEQFYNVSDYLSENYSNINFSCAIVRGLDYYTGTVFEVFANDQEINRSLFGGGRYDDLLDNYIKNANISGIGFGVGVDIFLLFLQQINKLQIQNTNQNKVYLALIQESKNQDNKNSENKKDTKSDPNRLKSIFGLTEKLIGEGYNVEVAEQNQIKNHFQKAEKKNSSFICFVGEKEFKEKKVIIKNLKTKQEKELIF